MFAENVIQAALEQVKTTRSTPVLNAHGEDPTATVSALVYSNSDVNGTNVTKVTFTTRYVPGANFLGS